MTLPADLNPTQKQIEWAGKIAKYAQDNYGYFGWDYIVECWERKEILEEIINSGATNYAAVLQRFRDISFSYNSQRREVRATAF